MVIIDTHGKVCPEPLIMTKQAISNADGESSFEIIGNNAIVRFNVMTYLKLLGYQPDCAVSDDDEFCIRFKNLKK
jgi:TusA-related sulfurtransferase